MSLVPQFLSILHHSAKIPLVNNSHAKFQGRTRNASFRSNQKSLQCKPAKNEKRTIDKKTTCSCNAIKLEIKFTSAIFTLLLIEVLEIPKSSLETHPGLLEAIISVKFSCR